MADTVQQNFPHTQFPPFKIFYFAYYIEYVLLKHIKRMEKGPGEIKPMEPEEE